MTRNATADDIIESLATLAAEIEDGGTPHFALVIIGDGVRPTSVVTCSNGDTDTYSAAARVLQLLCPHSASPRAS